MREIERKRASKRQATEQGDRSEREREREKQGGQEERRRGMSLNQLRTGKVVREAVVKLAKSYEGPLKVRGICGFGGARNVEEKRS